MDDSDSLVHRRPRRSTAGNRMEAALAEISIEDAQDADEDCDFVVDVVDEGDIFGSDFESTDDEITEPDGAVAEEEQRARKAVKSRLDKVTAAAAARQRVTFNPNTANGSEMLPSGQEKKRRRISPESAETAEQANAIRRRSGRSLTALARTASLARRVEEEKQKSSTPRKTKVKERPPTQDDLIKRALDMEDGNTAAHRDYLVNEEERRQRAHTVRVVVESPLVRWISRREAVRPLFSEPASATRSLSGLESTVSLIDSPSNTYNVRLAATSTAASGTPLLATIVPVKSTLSSSLPPPSQLATLPLRNDVVARQYVVHESSSDTDTRPPAWMDTMTALFGNHIAWEELRVYPAKNRPVSRPVLACPITGLPAPYRDPRSGTPFATPEAYNVLTKIMDHEYVWSTTLGCYTTPYETEDGTEAGAKDKKTVQSNNNDRQRVDENGEARSEV